MARASHKRFVDFIIFFFLHQKLQIMMNHQCVFFLLKSYVSNYFHFIEPYYNTQKYANF